jgi:hypothetical protein
LLAVAGHAGHDEEINLGKVGSVELPRIPRMISRRNISRISVVVATGC